MSADDDRQLVRLVDDVVVGQDEPVTADDDPGAEAADGPPLAAPALVRIAEEAAEELIAEKIPEGIVGHPLPASGLDDLLGEDGDDRRADLGRGRFEGLAHRVERAAGLGDGRRRGLCRGSRTVRPYR